MYGEKRKDTFCQFHLLHFRFLQFCVENDTHYLPLTVTQVHAVSVIDDDYAI